MSNELLVLVGVLIILLLSGLWQYLSTRVEKIPTYEQVAYTLDLLVVVIIILLIMLNHKATQNRSLDNVPIQHPDNQELPVYADELTLTNVHGESSIQIDPEPGIVILYIVVFCCCSVVFYLRRKLRKPSVELEVEQKEEEIEYTDLTYYRPHSNESELAIVQGLCVLYVVLFSICLAIMWVRRKLKRKVKAEVQQEEGNLEESDDYYSEYSGDEEINDEVPRMAVVKTP
ncbi:hypothetical protein HDV04_002140 [Boothiomyces sp. JEL0838]|nr:hypothetical protein HDV04_002140 [Boothiomyces sp. JEL0838]